LTVPDRNVKYNIRDHLYLRVSEKGEFVKNKDSGEPLFIDTFSRIEKIRTVALFWVVVDYAILTLILILGIVLFFSKNDTVLLCFGIFVIGTLTVGRYLSESSYPVRIYREGIKVDLFKSNFIPLGEIEKLRISDYKNRKCFLVELKQQNRAVPYSILIKKSDFFPRFHIKNQDDFIFVLKGLYGQKKWEEIYLE